MIAWDDVMGHLINDSRDSIYSSTHLNMVLINCLRDNIKY